MPRPLELTLLALAAVVAVFAVLIGAGYAGPLAAHVLGAAQDESWRAGELGRLLAAFFGPTLLGGAMLAGMAWHVVSSGKARRRVAMYPRQPWLWRADWAAGTVRLSNRPAIGITIGSLVFFGLVILPLGIYLASLKQAGLVYGFLTVLGAFLLLMVRLLWLNRRWSRSWLRLDTLPGSIGGTLAATVTLAEAFAPGTVFRATLRCDVTRSERVSSVGHEDVVDIALGQERGSGTRSTLQTWTAHEARVQITVDAKGVRPDATVLPIEFRIPGGLPPTGRRLPPPVGTSTLTRINEQCDWRLQISLERVGDPREVVFEVPVFADEAIVVPRAA